MDRKSKLAMSAAIAALAAYLPAGAARAEYGDLPQVAEAPTCTLGQVMSSSGGAVESSSGGPAVSGIDTACPQAASLPPMNEPAQMPTATERRELSNVYFGTGSAWIRDADIARLDYFTYYNILKQPYSSVKIIGYADDRGSDQANLALSTRRAEEVARFLESKGVPKDRLSISGAGAVRRSGESDIDRMMDRHIDIVVE